MASTESEDVGWRGEAAPRRWRAYALALAIASAPFFVRGLVALGSPLLSWGFLLGLFAMLVAGNVCILELPPYRFLHLTTGIIVFGGFFIAGPAALGLLLLSLKPGEILTRGVRRVDGQSGPPLGAAAEEYVVPAAAVAVVLGTIDWLHQRIGLSYPFRARESAAEVRLLLVLTVIYVAFVCLTELGIVLRFGVYRTFGTRRVRADLVVYFLAVLLGAPVVSAIARFYAPDPLHELFAFGWMAWCFGVFVVAQLLVARRLKIESLVSAIRRQERLAALGQLASVIAHQTRHHLGILNMSAYVLGETLAKEPLSPKAREATRHELEAIARTRDELDKLLARELRGGAEPQTFGLMALAHECAADLAPLAARREVALRYGDEEREVHGDRLRLKQAVSNVIRNAIEATSLGGAVTIELACRDGDVCLAVADEGPGLSAIARSHLFEPLFTEKPQGLGMGLYVARAIVEAHGGNIALASSDRGTRAEIHLGRGL